jgi:putative ABC transport system permease protein
MNLLALALRNLLRNRRRSLMTLLSMALGLMAVLLFGGYIKDMTYGLQTDFVKRGGHFQVQHKGYFLHGSGNPAAYGIRDYERVMATLRTDPVLAPMLAVVTPTLQFGGIAGNFEAGVSRTVYANGMVVEDQNRLRDWNAYGLQVLRKELTLSGTGPDAAVVGTGVARVLQLCAALAVRDCASAEEPNEAPAAGPALADDIAALSSPPPKPTAASPAGKSTAEGAGSAAPSRIEILAANARGAPNVAAVNVVRAEFQGVKELDDVFVGLHLAQAQKLVFGNAAPRVTSIALQLHTTDQMPAARERIDQLLATTFKALPLEVLDYETLNPYYGQTLQMFGAIFGFISVLIGAVVLFTIGNTMSMTVVERTVEIGTLRALGLRQGGIRAVFLAEGMVLGVAGSVVGVVAAIIAAWSINHLGITWVAPGWVDPVPLAVRVASEPLMMFVSAISLIVVAALSAILPAAKASRMNIVDALRHV